MSKRTTMQDLIDPFAETGSADRVRQLPFVFPGCRNDDRPAFGFGQHYGAGSHFARLEVCTPLGVSTDRLPGLRPRPDATSDIVGQACGTPSALPVLFG